MKIWFPCKVKDGRQHSGCECLCELPGSLHNRNWRIECGEKVWA